MTDIRGEIKVWWYARFWALEYVSSGAYLRGDIGMYPPPLGSRRRPAAPVGAPKL